METLPLLPNCGYYRYPTIHDDTIVFTSEGDLWKVDAQGGIAQRLTTHHGLESHPAISPDGTLLAFSAEYEGPTEVYTMPITGGRPNRHTYEGDSATVVGWTPDGKILYSTQHYSTLPNTQLATIVPHSSGQELLPLHQAANGSMTPDGKTLYFTRLPRQGSDTKRYMGGSVENIWRFPVSKRKKKKEAIPLTTDYLGTSKDPMCWCERVYFATDRDGTMNIWSMDENGGDLQQHTYHSGWDIKSPALHNGRVVYQAGADIYLYDINKDSTSVVPVTLASDFDQTRERIIDAPFKYLEGWDVSPTADRLALTARGRIFVFPTKQGRQIEVTRKHGVHYSDATFLPDGDSLVALSDESGEMEFWTFPANGIGHGEAITNNGSACRYGGNASPDGKWVAYHTRNFELWLLDLSTKQSKKIIDTEISSVHETKWSPDSGWLAYSTHADNQNRQIWLYSLEDDIHVPATTDWTDSLYPAWSLDGKWLYFVSHRHFESLVTHPWGARQPEPYFDQTAKIYMLALQKGLRSPFQADDEVALSQPQPLNIEARRQANGGMNSESGIEGKTGDDDEAGEKFSLNPSTEQSASEEVSLHQLQLDLEGLSERVYEVPLAPKNYRSLSLTGDHLYWVEETSGYRSKYHLKALPIKNQDLEIQTICSDISSYALTSDKKKICVRKNNRFYVFEANGEAPKNLEKERVNLSGWRIAIEPREEWRQMLTEAWRLERDYFYDPNMHGVDWQAQLDRHLALVERVRGRRELDDLIAHMISELSALHTDIRYGDKRRGSESEGTASLGAQLKPVKSGYRIDCLYRSDPDYPNLRGPLERPDLAIQEGDIIEAINGIDLNAIAHPSLLLKNQVDKQVLLRISSGSGTGDSGKAGNKNNKSNKNGQAYGKAKAQQGATRREVVVKPFSASRAKGLRYDAWEYERRQIVAEKSDGEIGYVHLRAMSGDNYSEWVRNFYPAFKCNGLIVDVRNNRGGNIDSWILEKLIRRAWVYWQPRVGKPYWNMQYSFRGHLIALCNEHTCSDGETFCEGVRRLGLGQVLGTRTWGGGVWLSPNTHLVDKGLARTAQTGVFTPEGEWAIEGHGIDPDIIVDNLPYATFNGEDAQLNAAISHLQEEIKREPIPQVQAPPYPDKSFTYR